VRISHFVLLVVLVSVFTSQAIDLGEQFDWWGNRNPKVQIQLDSQSVQEVAMVTLEDFSGCSVDIDRARLPQFLKSKNFTEEIRIFLIPGLIPSDEGPANGTFASTFYGAQIAVNSNLLGTAEFGEVVDHEFSHMVQWLELGEEDYLALSKQEREDYATAFAQNNDLDFITADISVQISSEEGFSYGPLFFRREEDRPVLYVFDKNRPSDIYILINGKIKMAQSLDLEGWHVVPQDQFEQGLVTYGGYCARLN